jgi:hypothetical protein
VQIAGGAMVTVSMIGVLFWKDAQMWLAVPTSVFCMTLLPLAYFSFFLLMNQKRLLGDNLPRGGWRVLWNVLMGVSASLAAFGSVWSIWSKAGFYGLVGLGIFTGLVVATHFIRKRRPAETAG